MALDWSSIWQGAALAALAVLFVAGMVVAVRTPRGQDMLIDLLGRLMGNLLDKQSARYLAQQQQRDRDA